MKKKTLFKVIILLVMLGIIGAIVFLGNQSSAPESTTIWSFESIDTMKYSRDLSRQELNNPSFDAVIDTQIKNIAATGATYVAIDTPYDEEFFPMLQRWVAAARKYNLKVWFRGNWSGWEGWFGYPAITRQEHIAKTQAFILKHSAIFQNGDIFTACPECENGGPGDPRVTGDIKGQRQFLIDEYQVTKAAFKQIGKNVASNYDSMNGDVATAVMDKATTKALDGIVTIDHYIATPEQLAAKVQALVKQSGGKIVLGEFGVPIPNVNGNMTEAEQAAWISRALQLLENTPDVVGMNYWTNVGSSTALWNDDGSPRKAVSVITNFYGVRLVSGVNH